MTESIPSGALKLAEEWCKVWHRGDTIEGEAADIAARSALRAALEGRKP